jgi:hypothetical protein
MSAVNSNGTRATFRSGASKNFPSFFGRKFIVTQLLDAKLSFGAGDRTAGTYDVLWNRVWTSRRWALCPSANLPRAKHWIERRLSERRQFNTPVLVLQRSQVQSGLLVDLSEDGFGLSKVTGLVADELVSIATEDGRVFEGRVAWVNGNRAGASLISQS